jgi:hypothetical protein
VNDYPVLRLVHRLPGSLRAITLPPYGILMERGMSTELSRRVREHELIHWEQYLRGGAVKFYWDYLTWFLKGGSYKDHPMEIEARERSDIG